MEGTLWGGNDIRFLFSVLIELFLHASHWPVMLLTSTFSSGEFQGRGNEQVHVLPPFLALQHFIRTHSLCPISSLLTLGRIGMRIGVKVMPLEDKYQWFFPQGFACLKSLTIIYKANPGDT